MPSITISKLHIDHSVTQEEQLKHLTGLNDEHVVENNATDATGNHEEQHQKASKKRKSMASTESSCSKNKCDSPTGSTSATDNTETSRKKKKQQQQQGRKRKFVSEEHAATSPNSSSTADQDEENDGTISATISCFDRNKYCSDVSEMIPQNREVACGVSNLGNTCYISAVLQASTADELEHITGVSATDNTETSSENVVEDTATDAIENREEQHQKASKKRKSMASIESSCSKNKCDSPTGSTSATDNTETSRKKKNKKKKKKKKKKQQQQQGRKRKFEAESPVAVVAVSPSPAKVNQVRKVTPTATLEPQAQNKSSKKKNKNCFMAISRNGNEDRKIKIGRAYQAILPQKDREDNSYRAEYNLVWDPERANNKNSSALASSSSEIDAFLDKVVEANLEPRYHSLHESQYNVNQAERTFRTKEVMEHDDRYVPWTTEEENKYHNTMMKVAASGDSNAYNSFVIANTNEGNAQNNRRRRKKKKKDTINVGFLRYLSHECQRSPLACMLYYYNVYVDSQKEMDFIRHQNGFQDICTVCGKEGLLICCDTCNKPFHLDCVSPPLKEVPEDDWFCNTCK